MRGTDTWSRCLRNLVRGGVAALLPFLVGCVVVEARLAPDGSGTVVVRYKVAADATEFLEKRRFASPHITVVSMKIEENLQAEMRATFDDVTQIAAATAFRDVTVEWSETCGGKSVVVTIRHPQAPPSLSNQEPGPRFIFSFPGVVTKANRDGIVSGDRVTWAFSIADYLAEPVTDLRAWYTPGGAPVS
jgi:hypothetical protein